MRFFDIHTHHPSCSPYIASVMNCGTTPAPAGTTCSVGIHPWDITINWEEEIERVRNAASASNVVAIGECGIDKLNSPADITLQTKVLTAHATLAEEVKKPLILHCVKGQDEIIKLHRSMRPAQAWIIHGFRGKAQQALQLLNEGFYLSFGENFNKEALIATPADRLFIETDTSELGIAETYCNIAFSLGVSSKWLAFTMDKNFKACNINIP